MGSKVRGQRSEVNRTFAAALHLPAAEQGVVDEVGQPPVEVHGGQAALEALPGDHQLRETLVHVGAQAPDEQITWRRREGGERDKMIDWTLFILLL